MIWRVYQTSHPKNIVSVLEEDPDQRLEEVSPRRCNVSEMIRSKFNVRLPLCYLSRYLSSIYHISIYSSWILTCRSPCRSATATNLLLTFSPTFNSFFSSSPLVLCCWSRDDSRGWLVECEFVRYEIVRMARLSSNVVRIEIILMITVDKIEVKIPSLTLRHPHSIQNSDLNGWSTEKDSLYR